MKINERRVPRLLSNDPGSVRNGSGNGSERSRMIPEVSEMVPGVSEMISGIYGRFGRTGRLLKVLEGSGMIRTIERSPDGSIIGAATFP